MQCRTRHPTDDDLLLLDDPQALRGRRGRATRQHVGECARCAVRQAELAAELAEVAALWRGTGAAEARMDGSPAVAQAAAARERAHRVARVRFAAALDARAAQGASGRRRLTVVARAVLPAAATVLVALAVVTAPRVPGVVPADSTPVALRQNPPAAAVRLLPDRRLTPGAVRPVTAVEACRGDVPAAPAAAAGVPRQVFARYGIDYRRAEEYELDFLITPELGGAAEARNLWPQPYGATVWNAYVKDELERHLSRMVCAGVLDLGTAQRDIASDWIGAYRRYFDTSRPRRDYRRPPLTGRDAGALRGEAIDLRFLPRPPAAALVASSAGSRGGVAGRPDGPAGGAAPARGGALQPGRFSPEQPQRMS